MGLAVLAAEDCGDETPFYLRPEGLWKSKAQHTFAVSRLFEGQDGMEGDLYQSLRFLAFHRKEKETTFSGECSLITSKASDPSRVPASYPQRLWRSVYVTALPVNLLLPW